MLGVNLKNIIYTIITGNKEREFRAKMYAILKLLLPKFDLKL